MGSVKRIARNIFFLSSSEIVVKFLQAVLIIFIARVLKQTEFGEFTFALAFSTITIIFVDLGMQTFIVREISRNKKLINKYITNAAFLKILLSIAGFILVAAGLNLMQYGNGIKLVVYLIYGAYILKSFTELFSSVFFGLEKMKWNALLNVLRIALLTVAISVILLTTKSLFHIALAYLGTELVVVALSLIINSLKFVKLKFSLDLKFMKKFFMKSLPFALTIIFYKIYFYSDSVMLSKLKGNLEVGLYGAAYNIPLALVFVPAIFTFAIFPFLSRSYLNSKKDLLFSYKKSILYLGVIALPIVLVLTIASDNIIHFLYGIDYHESAFILKILAITIFFRFISFVNGTTLTAINKQKQRVFFQGITAGINIILNFILISKYSFLGAAIATVASELLLFLLYFFAISKYLRNLNDIFILSKPLIAILFTSIVFLMPVSTLLKIVIVLVSYSLILLFLKVFKKEDLDIIKKIFEKSNA